MHVGGVAGDQHPSGTVGVGDPVVDPEAGPPHDLGDPDRALGATAPVEKALDVGDVGLLRGVGDRRHEPERAVGQRRGDQGPFGREVENDLVVRQVTLDAYVGEAERLGVLPSREPDPGPVADGGVHAVGADEVAGADLGAVLRGGGDAFSVLVEVDEGERAAYVTTELGEALEEDALGDGLGDHQCVGEVAGQVVEADRHQHLVAVTDGEARRLDALLDEALGDAELGEDLQGAGVDDRGPGGVVPAGLVVDDGDVDAGRGQLGRDREPGGAGAGDEDISGDGGHDALPALAWSTSVGQLVLTKLARRRH